MKVLVTGVNGQLGHDVALELFQRGHVAVGSGSACTYRGTDAVRDLHYVQMDIKSASETDRIICDLLPDAVIHCSAWTAVDAAEDEENRETVRMLNVNGPENIAKACRHTGAKMLYLSTDYVFDGKGERPWRPDDRCFAPLNVYGQSKLDGEFAVARNMECFFIVRIAAVCGLNGKNLVKTMIDSGRRHNSVRVVNDQIGTPTYTKDLARLLVDMIETEKYGYYHATNEGGYISWYDYCVEFYRQYGLQTKVIPVSTAEYGLSKAARPFNSRLDKSKLAEEGFIPLPDWRDAIRRYLEEAYL